MWKPLVLDTWETVATTYPASKYGVARINHKRRGGGIYYAEYVRGVTFLRYPPKSLVTSLRINGVVWMTDCAPYMWSLASFAERASGNVLVAGLGLGLVIHELVKNPNVTHITVVDREPDVIALVALLLPQDSRIEIVESDFDLFVMHDSPSVKRDTIIWDLGLWGSSGEEHNKLKALYIRPIMQSFYGPATQVFVHGLDRDPAGEQFIQDNPELVSRLQGGILSKKQLTESP